MKHNGKKPTKRNAKSLTKHSEKTTQFTQRKRQYGHLKAFLGVFRESTNICFSSGSWMVNSTNGSFSGQEIFYQASTQN